MQHLVQVENGRTVEDIWFAGPDSYTCAKNLDCTRNRHQSTVESLPVDG
jgi:hypothetical protein